MEWTQGESGPDCYCGNCTVVVICEGFPSLMCFLHSREEGAMFPLPFKKPANWPNLNHDEMKVLVEQGMVEHERGGPEKEVAL